MGYVYLVLTAICVSITTLSAKFATDSTSNIYILFIYFTSGAVISSAILFFNKSSRSSSHSRPRVRRDWAYFTAHSLLVGLGWQYTLNGLRLLNAGQVSFYSRMEIILTVGLAIIIFQEKLKKMAYLGGLFVILGIFVMKSVGLGHAESMTGFWQIFFASICFVLVDIFAKLVSGAFSASTFTAMRNTALAIYFLAVMFYSNLEWQITPDYLAVLVLGGLSGPGLARVFYMLSIEKIPLTICTLLSQSEPVITAILAFIFLNESFGLVESAGGFLIILGVLLILDFRKIFLSARFRIQGLQELRNSKR